MKKKETSAMAQKDHWNEVYGSEPDFFGEGPSDCARIALDLFRENQVGSVLELGCGQGRDSLLFARNGLSVTALDYSETAVSAVRERAGSLGLSSLVRAQTCNVKEPLPFADQTFDACYSHMLLCMELSTAEIAFILREIHRLLRPGGLVVYSVRSNFDRHFRTGRHIAEDIYEVGGFVIHFIDEQKIRKLARGYRIQTIERIEEGSLPRDLFIVTMKKTAEPADRQTDNQEKKEDMKNAMKEFQTFLDTALAPGRLEHKTKQLVGLGAALAAGCDP
jgi:SAM-dependent methyltransferase